MGEAGNEGVVPDKGFSNCPLEALRDILGREAKAEWLGLWCLGFSEQLRSASCAGLWSEAFEQWVL